MVVVAMRQNLHELPDLVRLAHRLSIDTVFVQHLCHDFGESSLPANYRPMRDFVEAETLLNEDRDRDPAGLRRGDERVAASWASTCGCRGRSPGPTPPARPGRTVATGPGAGAYVSYQGLAMPCCMVATPDRINLGNMAESGAEAVWNGEDYEAFRGGAVVRHAARGLPLLRRLFRDVLKLLTRLQRGV